MSGKDDAGVEREHPRAKDGQVLSGVCDKCGNPIYTMSDHGDCLWGVMAE